VLNISENIKNKIKNNVETKLYTIVTCFGCDNNTEYKRKYILSFDICLNV